MLYSLNRPKPAIVASVAQNYRQLSSLPHHLARHNNGMVNILVKNTKVPRPTLPKTFNKLKKPHRDDVAIKHIPSHLSYAGNKRMPITSEMKIVMPGEDAPSGIWPVFRMLVRNSNIILDRKLLISFSFRLTYKILLSSILHTG